MPENFPINPGQPEKSGSKSEHEPVSYEKALAAAKFLYASGEKNPLSGEYKDPHVQAAWDIANQWEVDCGLDKRGVGTAEKANNIVRAATIWIDTGYTEPELLRYALERLNDEHADALREGNDEVIVILRSAADMIETKLASLNPKEKISAQIEAKFEEAQGLIKQGKLLSAIGTLHGALFLDPRFKGRMTEEQRRRFTELRDATKESERSQNPPRK